MAGTDVQVRVIYITVVLRIQGDHQLLYVGIKTSENSLNNLGRKKQRNTGGGGRMEVCVRV